MATPHTMDNLEHTMDNMGVLHVCLARVCMCVCVFT